MRFLGPIVALLLLLAPAPAGAAPAARATLADCDRQERRASFQGDMHAVAGSEVMQMRFALRALEDGRWRRVRAPGLGEWLSSDPGVARYVFTKTVENLPAPGLYRARVAFRWLDAEGAVLARRSRGTPVCRVPDRRPDLRAVAVLRRADGWAVLVRNTGRSRADVFDVAAVVDGADRGSHAVDGLDAGEETLVAFDGGCGTIVEVTVDPYDAIDERDEDDNVLRAPCPAAR